MVSSDSEFDIDVKDIFLAGGIPRGASFVAAGPNPTKSGFRAVEDNNAVWLSEAVAAKSEVGPFSYRVKLAADSGDAVHAWTHWRSPVDGTNQSDQIRALPSFTAAVLASGRVESLPDGPLMWQVFDNAFPAQYADSRTQPTPRLVYVTGGSARTFAQGGVVGTYGPGSAHFIRPGVPFDDFVRSDTAVRFLVFNATPSRGRNGPAPRPYASTVFESEDLPGLKGGAYNVILVRAEFQPGARVPLNQHPGPGLVYVLEGTLSHTEQGSTQTYSAGGMWVEATAEPNTTTNVGNGEAKVLV